MKCISIIVPDGQSDLNTVGCIAGASEIFAEANRFYQCQSNKALFRIQTVSATAEPIQILSILLKPDVSINEIKSNDLIVIPSCLIKKYESATKGNKILIKWIEEQYKSGAEIASMCSGAFMLAATGLLDGRNCSTHWAVSADFRLLFPAVNLRSDKMITDENGIYTNGGAYSFLHLILYLVEKYFNRQTAIHCSKMYQIDLDRKLQSEFAIFSGHKKHADEMVLNAQNFIEKNFQEKISMERLSAESNIGRRSFDRRFIRSTGITPLEYLQRVRIEAAKKSFEVTRKNISEVMYEVGYNDTKAFREVFGKITGISPIKYKNKYNKTV